MKKLIFGLVTIVLISGCVGMPDILKGIFPGAGPQVTELPPDLIVIQNINTLPIPPINTGDQFTVSFEIKNQDEIRDVSGNVTVQLFDYGLCKPDKSSFTPTGWSESGGVYNYNFNGFDPLQTELIEWTFTAPKSEEIAYLSTKCPVRFKVNYSSSATSQVDISVISSTRLKELQRTGQTPTYTPDQTVGRGPLKIYFDFGTSFPVKSGSILPVYITIEDKGSGLIEGGDLPKGSLKLNVNTSIFTIDQCDKFEKVDDSGVKNNQTITMIRKKSIPLKCSFRTPSVDIEKTYLISASLDYSYSITQEVNVQIKP